MKIKKFEDLKVGDWINIPKISSSKFIILGLSDDGEIRMTSPCYLSWHTITVKFSYYEITLIGRTRPRFRLLYRLFSGPGGIICPFKMIPIKNGLNVEKEFLKQIQ
jgi:hypothetical protein